MRHQCSETVEKFNSQNIEIKKNNIIIISFNLVQSKLQQSSKSILFTFNDEINLLLKKDNYEQYLIIEQHAQQHYIGQINDYQSQITLQIENYQFQEYQYFIQFYENQNLKGEIRIKKRFHFIAKRNLQLIQVKQSEELQIVNIILLTNFKISQIQNKNQQVSNCLLKAISVNEKNINSHICIFYYINDNNQNILELNIQNKHQKRNLAAFQFIHGSNMRSILRNSYQASQFKTTITSAQSINTVLIFGYFKLSQTIGTSYLPLITIGDFSDYYNIFNIYFISNALIELKYINDIANNIITQQFNLGSDYTNNWLGVGIYYSKTNSQIQPVIKLSSNQVFIVLSNIYTVTIPSTIQTLDVCISCKIEGGIFDKFEGNVSSVKIIYDVNSLQLSSYTLYNEQTNINTKNNILSASFNINSYTPNSEYNLGQGFACNPGYAFFEGICINLNNCKNLIQDQNEYSSFEAGKFYDSTSKKCLDCPSNCLECSSSSVCITCRPSYKIVNQICIRCDDSNPCNSSCLGQQVFDPMNQICVDTFSASLQSLSNLLLSSRIITNNSDVLVDNSPPFSSINDQIIHCYIDVSNNPMTLHSFLGGQQFTTSTIIKKSFIQIPKGYQKSVAFYVLFYGSGNSSNIQVKINSNFATLDSWETIVSNKVSCSGSGTQTQSIFKVKFSIQDYQNTFNLEIQSTSSKWGIRNLNFEISKCHPTCESCKVGGGVADCTACNSSLTQNQFQCTCPFGKYAEYQNCFDSPCVSCSSCSIQNCQKCEDITGNCTQCIPGYYIKDSQCVINTQCNINDTIYFNFCGVLKEEGFTHFKQDRIVQYADYWRFYDNYIEAVNCLTRKCTPILTYSRQHTLTMVLPNYFLYHYMLNIDIELFEYQAIDEDDFVNLYDGDQQIYRHCFYEEKKAIPNEPYNDGIFSKSITYTKNNQNLQFKYESQSDQWTYNEGQCHPMCKACTESKQSDCKSCIDNASVVGGNCQCNNGYYFSMIRFPNVNTLPGSCLKCNPACKKCIGPSYQDCSECQDGYTNTNNICQYNCKDGKYWDNATMQCLSCNICCKTCDGGSNNNCHDCMSGYFLNYTYKSCMIYNNHCQTCTVAVNSLCGGSQGSHIDCLNQYWVVLDVNNCVYCGKYINNKCGGDYSQNVVEFCIEQGFLFNFDSSNCSSCTTFINGNCGRSEIKDRCKDYGYKQFDDNQCKNCNVNSITFSQCVCHSSCQTCSDYFLPYYCITCQPSLYLFNNNQCLPKCPNGYIIDGLNCIQCTEKQMPVCVSCYRTCLICNPFKESLVSNSCTACSTLTRKLVNGQCKCLDLEDSRESFHECSYLNIAVINAILSNSTPLLTIYFGKQLSIPNNFQSDVYSSSLCQYLFTDQTKELLGSASECTISGQFIAVLLDNDSQIFDGDLIYFQKNVLSFASSSSTLIDTYLNLRVVQNKITGQSKVSFNYLSVENSCNNISIKFKNISNGAKRGFKQFSWSLKSYLPANPGLQALLENVLQKANNENNIDLLIVKGIIKPNMQVKIRLDYTLKANVVSYEEFNLSVKPEKKIFLGAQSSIISPFFRYQSAVLVISSVVMICDPDGDYQVAEPLNISFSSIEYPYKDYQNPNYLLQEYQIEFQPYALQPGKIIFNINAKLASESFIESEINYEINIIPSNLYVKIEGGNGYFNYKKPVTIKGKARDYDIQNETDPQEIDILWKCVDPSTQNICVDKDGNQIIFPSQILTATIKAFSFNPYTSIKIELIGDKSPNRQTTDSITILFSELDLPPLGVQIGSNDPKKETVNLNEEIFVILDYNSSVNVDLLSYSGTIQYENEVVGIIGFDYTSLRFQIWNYYGNFKRNSIQFQIRFNVFNPKFYMPSIFTSTLNINFPPNQCQLTVSPNIGYSVETKFIMSFENCEDENQPIYYQFFYYQSSDEFEYEKKNPLQVKRRQLNDKSQNYHIQSFLPSGYILILAQAIDSKNAIYNTTLEINVQLKLYDESSYLALIQQKLDQINKLQTSTIISDLSIICDDILKRNYLQFSASLNSKKIEILNSLTALQKSLSLLSTFSTVVDKAITSLIQSGIIYNSSEQQNLLSQLIDSLDDSSNFQQSNIELSKEKLKQKLYDSFQMVDAFGSKENIQLSSEKIIELTDKIGGYLFKNILPNEDPIYFQGKQTNIFGVQMTEKYVCVYFLCEHSTPIDSTKQTSIYNLKRSEYNNNPYSSDETFLNYTDTIKKLNPEQSISSYQVITPTISTQQNFLIESFPKQAILNFPIQSTSTQKNMTCLTKNQEKGWTKNGCQNVYQKKSNSYLCICDDLQPTTIIDDLEALLNNNNIKTAFSSDGIQNILSFREFYKYIAFWLLSFQTILFITLYYFGYKLDSIDYQQKIEKIKNFNLFEQNNTQKSHFSKYKVTPLNLNKNDLEDTNMKEDINIKEIKCETIQTEQIYANSPMINQLNIQFDNSSQKSNLMKEAKIQQSQIMQNIENFNINTPQKLSLNKVLENSPQLDDIETFQLNGESQYNIFNKLNKNTSQRKSNLSTNSPKNNNIISKQFDGKAIEQISLDNDTTQKRNINPNIQNTIQKRKNTIAQFSQKFDKLPVYKQVIIFHNFFGIFLLFNPDVPRTLRFFIFYMRSIHSFGIAVVFDQEYNPVQKIAISVINAVSIIVILKILEVGFSIKNIIAKIVSRIISGSITLGYYYIILSIVSGLEPNKSNQCIYTFILFYLIDVCVFSLCSALIQRLIAKNILKNVIIYGFKRKLYTLIQLKLILISIR